jgi:hypothetical protein
VRKSTPTSPALSARIAKIPNFWQIFQQISVLFLAAKDQAKFISILSEWIISAPLISSRAHGSDFFLKGTEMYVQADDRSIVWFSQLKKGRIKKKGVMPFNLSKRHGLSRRIS